MPMTPQQRSAAAYKAAATKRRKAAQQAAAYMGQQQQQPRASPPPPPPPRPSGFTRGSTKAPYPTPPPPPRNYYTPTTPPPPRPKAVPWANAPKPPTLPELKLAAVAALNELFLAAMKQAGKQADGQLGTEEQRKGYKRFKALLERGLGSTTGSPGFAAGTTPGAEQELSIATAIITLVKLTF